MQETLDQLTNVALVVFVIFSVISISIMQTAYILAVVTWITRVYLQGSHRQVRCPLILPLSGFALASALATITAVDPYRSLLALRHLFAALLFYLVVNQVTTEERTTRLTRVLIAASAVMALYGLAQSLAYGVDFRVHGTMSIYMTFAGLLMLVAVMTLAQVLFRPHRRQAVWVLLALLIITTTLIMTHTRGAWLGFIAGCCVLLGLHNKVFLLALPLLVLAVFLLVPQAVKTRALSILDRRNITAQERLSMWSSGLHIIREHPWTGVGMGAMARVYQRYREPDSPVNPTRRLGHLHNNMIQIAVERGLPGLACWLWLWLAYGYDAWRIYKRLGPEHTDAKALVLGSLASVVAFHVEGLFEYTFGDAEVMTLVYCFMALPCVVQRARCSAPALVSAQ
jgi:O-antigen ligase